MERAGTASSFVGRLTRQPTSEPQSSMALVFLAGVVVFVTFSVRLVLLFGELRNRHYVIAFVDLDESNALRRPSQDPDSIDPQTQDHPVASYNHDLVFIAHKSDADH